MKYIALLAPFLLAAVGPLDCASAQSISVVIDASGDGIHPVYEAWQTVVDSSGNQYLGDRYGHRVYKRTPAGIVTEAIGPNGDGASVLNIVTGMDTDSAGNLFVCGGASNNLFKITPGGTITEILDSTGDGSAGVIGSYDVAIDGAGNALVASYKSVYKITPGGVIRVIMDETGAGGGRTFDGGRSIEVDSLDNVYVVGNQGVFRIAPGGAVTLIVDQSGDGQGNSLNAPGVLAVDGMNNVYVTNLGPFHVLKVTPGGVIHPIIDAAGDGHGNVLTVPGGLDTDHAGNVYVTGSISDNAFMITAGGFVTEIIDSSGDGSTLLDEPWGIAATDAGTVYVAALGSQVLFEIEEPGSVGSSSCDCSGGNSPCFNVSTMGRGCPNSNANGRGARLIGVGAADSELDQFSLVVSDAAPNKPGLILAGTNSLGPNGSGGVPDSAGTLCVGGLTRRGFVALTDGTGAAHFSSFQGLPFGASDLVSAGTPITYTYWFRDPGTAFGCLSDTSSSDFNFSNGWTVIWQ